MSDAHGGPAVAHRPRERLVRAAAQLIRRQGVSDTGMLSALEGAIILARIQRDLMPLDTLVA